MSILSRKFFEDKEKFLQVKQVNSINYLGSLITSGCKCDMEIERRIAMAKDEFPRMKNILTNSKIKISIKVKLGQLKFFVHIMRKEKVENLTTTRKIAGKKKRDRGQQRTTFVKSLFHLFNKPHYNYYKVLKIGFCGADPMVGDSKMKLKVDLASNNFASGISFAFFAEMQRVVELNTQIADQLFSRN
ncbi:hypothetical protein HELRODRAFT_177966 [Helobdella robusta]|uniref:Uncharacterized protein n=1 Tax=Helobdella robusta TaxID=6412 RepID=T1FCJ2_HELRO|nr:hypothetical protein HELRODRAFT_177966 [Helobdella robusta]ESN97535.1 hypothetical protein HELRODRAFT_177966 [Helobdella robusta]